MVSRGIQVECRHCDRRDRRVECMQEARIVSIGLEQHFGSAATRPSSRARRHCTSAARAQARQRQCGVSAACCHAPRGVFNGARLRIDREGPVTSQRTLFIVIRGVLSRLGASRTLAIVSLKIAEVGRGRRWICRAGLLRQRGRVLGPAGQRTHDERQGRKKWQGNNIYNKWQR